MICTQDSCEAPGTIWFRFLIDPPQMRMTVEFDVSWTPPDGERWRWLCKPHMNGALVVIEDAVDRAMN